MKGLDPAKIVAIRRVAGNIYGKGGGGIEILYRGNIPPIFLKLFRGAK